MKNFTLGRYMPLDSWMHSLDPRAKIVAMLLLMVAIFIPAGYFGYAILALVVALGIKLTKLKPNFIINAMKPMVFMLLFLLVVNILVIKTGFLLMDIGGFKIYSDAFSQTFYIVIRLALMIVVTTLLTASTKPLDLTVGLEDLMEPLKKLHVPTHEIAMIISIALRFIPTLIEEAQRIMKAQASRGVDLEEGSLKEKMMCILSLIVPLFVSAFQRAEDLADAMEARGYIPDKKRTRYRQLKLGKRDYLLIAFCSCLLIGLIGISVVW